MPTTRNVATELGEMISNITRVWEYICISGLCEIGLSKVGRYRNLLVGSS